MIRGEVLALFPTRPEGSGVYDSYAHFGQHSAAHWSLFWKGRPATPEEYGPLLNELGERYPNLKVMKRRPRR